MSSLSMMTCSIYSNSRPFIRLTRSARPFLAPKSLCFRSPITIILELSLIHISEPTRRYAISYAVFCLKKKIMITTVQVENSQQSWGNGVVKIGSLKNSRNECEAYCKAFLDERYAFDAGNVLFKPTKCATEQFRPSKLDALSYFIAGEDRNCLLYTSPSPRDATLSRMPSSA